MNHAEMAALLKAKLTEAEFLRLQELLDGSRFGMSAAVSKLASEIAPELFVQPEAAGKGP